MSFDVTSASLIWYGQSNGLPRLPSRAARGGVAIDNTVGFGYPCRVLRKSISRPLTNQTCTTSGGTGGCGIQASQSALD